LWLALASDWGWRHLVEAASTQDTAILAAQSGERGPLAVIAERQTQGRGSRGRAWAGAEGNLFLSLLIRPENRFPPGLYALQAGVTLHDALIPYATGLMLKWPNDVLLNGAKLGGVLIDAAPDQNWLVIGIGANLRHAPDIAGRRTAALPPPAPTPLAVAESITRHLNLFATAEEITASWLARAHKPGTFLDITLPNGHIQGRFAGIDATGALQLEGRDTPISSGEIFLGTAD
jgi:BirA family biotin operon repressor/biotin-[acetyl-CoA-carboxylase] ligase